jgi:hypothetical protein
MPCVTKLITTKGPESRHCGSPSTFDKPNIESPTHNLLLTNSVCAVTDNWPECPLQLSSLSLAVIKTSKKAGEAVNAPAQCRPSIQQVSQNLHENASLQGAHLTRRICLLQLSPPQPPAGPPRPAPMQPRCHLFPLPTTLCR